MCFLLGDSIFEQYQKILVFKTKFGFPMTGFLSKGNSFTRLIHRVTLQRELIHKIHSQGSSSQQYMFYIHSTHVPQKRTRRTALIQSWSSHMDSCFHHYMISQLINKSKFRSTNSSSPCLQPQRRK